jgi:hypothetical protein
MDTKKTPLFFAVALAAIAAPAPLGAQARPQAPIFGTGIEIINLSLSVTDAQNNFVTNLGQSDFAVFEDGIRQELSLFTHENLPISLVLMIDTSASMEEKLATAQAAAIRFTKTLRTQDLAQIVQFNDRATTLQAFTNDTAVLEAAIKRTEAAGPTALHNALYIALKDLMRDKKAAELRRRAIVLLSDGEDTASLVTDDQPAAEPRERQAATGLQPGRVPHQRAHPRDRRPSFLPVLDRRARIRLRPDRGGAPHALQRRLRVVERPPRRQVAADRGARARPRGSHRPPQARLLRAAVTPQKPSQMPKRNPGR